MLGSRNLVAFVATTNAARARVFYEKLLGLRFVADEPWALVFDAHATMLRIQKVEKLTPQPHTSLGWEVPDIAAILHALQEAGVRCERYDFLEQDELGIWSTPSGAKIAWFKDPDGNTLSLTQF
jgi:catechol 2,3-dioxygenase-like lactoylglutathione lyase family enzyme